MVRKILIQRTANLKVMRKVGLDSGILVCLVEDIFGLGQQVYSKIFSQEGLFFTHRRCIGESIKVLQEKKGVDPETAKKRINEHIAKMKIGIIEKDFSNELAQDIFKKDLLHFPDCFILADFIKNGINTVYSVDKTFIKVARNRGLDANYFQHMKEKSDADRIKYFFRNYK